MVEKCIVCNGRGTEQVFIDGKWSASENRCKVCKGSGKRKYYILDNSYSFTTKKIYEQ